MNGEELVEQFREDTDDQTEPYLWKTPTLLRYANQAVEEAARRARILLDSTTKGVCTYDVKVDEPWIQLHAAVIEIKHAQLRYTDPDDETITRVARLRRAHSRDMDREDSSWRESKGDPCRYITDIETGKIRFDSIPARIAVLELEVARMPIRKMADLKACPEIPTRYHADLVHWMRHRAYSKVDAETNNPQQAATALAQFENIFGEPSSAIDEQWHGNKPDFRRSTTRWT